MPSKYSAMLANALKLPKDSLLAEGFSILLEQATDKSKNTSLPNVKSAILPEIKIKLEGKKSDK